MSNEKNTNEFRIKKSVLAVIVICVLIAGAVIGILVNNMAGKKQDKKNSATNSKATSEKNDDTIIDTSNINALDYIELGDYKGMKVSLAVSDEDIQSEIDSVKEEYTTYKELKGKAKEGDMVHATFEGYINGKRADATCGSEYVQIGSGDWVAGFEDAIVGMKTGTNKIFDIDIPDETYGDKNIDGKTVEFHVTLDYICGDQIVPEYNDEFVKSISSDCNTTDEYNEYLRKKLLRENKKDRADYAWSDLVELCKVKEYPKDMVKNAEKKVLQGYYDMAEIYNKSKDEIFTQFGYESEADFKKKDLKELAQDSVKEVLVARGLAKTENISYSDADYSEVVDEEYAYNQEKYSSKEKYEKAERESLQDETLQNAVKEWLKDNITYTTK